MIESAVPQGDDFPRAFESAFARLQVLIEEACSTQLEWQVAQRVDQGKERELPVIAGEHVSTCPRQQSI